MKNLVLALSAGALFSLAAASADRSAAPAGAEVYFISPRDGAKVHGPVTVQFGLKGMGVAPAGVKFDNTGHHHLLIDTDLSEVNLDAPLLATDKILHFGKGQTETTLNLSAGKHTLEIVFADYTHQSFDPALHSKENHHHRGLIVAGSEGAARAILHIDMDAFYASVEERDNPALKGALLIVGGTRGRGVVTAASYAVRRYGVHSAMPMRDALRRCPDAIVVHPRMARYQEVSEQVFAIFHAFTPLVEGLSLDEAFLDITGSQKLLGPPEAIAAEIRRRITHQTGLTASVGIAPNKLLAKIASDLNKPDGMCRIDAGNLRAIMDALPIERLYGVGRKTLPRVQAAGILTCGDARRASDAVLHRAFGKHGYAMRDRAAGIDDRPVEPDREEKSISAEETYSGDISDVAQLKSQLVHLADRTATRLRAHDIAAATVTIKIRRADFSTFTRQRALEPPTQDTAAIAAAALLLLGEWLAPRPRVAVRLLGVGVSRLQPLRQADLFTAVQPAAGARLDSAVDGIRGRFGNDKLTRASLLPRVPGGRES